ncbi:MAG: hypothetical protein WDW36_006264 [Sanguina aurantia]
MMMKAQIRSQAFCSRRSTVAVRATNGAPPTSSSLWPRGAARQGLQGLKTPSLAGPAPELVNARLAMLGFAGAFGAEFTSHVCLVEQFESAAVPVLVTVLLVIAGTFAPILFNGNLKEASGIWTPAAELKNGRSAMIGIAAWLALEQHAGMPMTNVTWEIFSKAHGL